MSDHHGHCTAGHDHHYTHPIGSEGAPAITVSDTRPRRFPGLPGVPPRLRARRDGTIGPQPDEAPDSPAADTSR